MTTFLIIVGILAFIFILLICPLSFSIIYDGECELKIRYLFLNFKIFPPKEKKNKKVKKTKKHTDKRSEEKPQEKKKNPIFDMIKENGINGLIELLKKICEIFIKSASQITKHIVVSRLDVNILVVGEDAADTAMKFGYVCSAVYPLISIIDTHVKKCNHNENIVAGFNDTEMKIMCVIKARIKPIFLIVHGGSAVFKWIKAIAK